MESLEYLRFASHYPDLHAGDFPSRIKVNLVTNFTDEVLKKMLVEATLHENIYPRSTPPRTGSTNFN